MNFRQFLEIFDSSASIQWMPPQMTSEGLTYLGYFEVPVKGEPTKTIRYRLRMFVTDATDYKYDYQQYGVNIPKGEKAARFTFGRWGERDGRMDFTPTTPRPHEPQPEELMVYGTVIKGYGELIEKINPALLYMAAWPDSNYDTFQTRKSLYNRIGRVIGQKMGYTKITEGGQVTLLLRKDLLDGKIANRASNYVGVS